MSENPPRLSIWSDEEAAGLPYTDRSDVTIGDVWAPQPQPPPAPLRPVEPQGEAAEEAESAGDGPPATVRRRPRILSRRVAISALLVLTLAFVADAGYVAARIGSSMYDAKTSLADARRSISDGDMLAAEAALDDAQAEVGNARAATSHPAFLVASIAPDARAMESVIEASRLAVEAGQRGLDAAEELGVRSGEVTDSLYVDGRVDLEGVQEAAPALEDADNLLNNSLEVLDEAPDPMLSLLDQVVTDARTNLEAAASTAGDGADLFRILPELLGAEGDRTYLLAFQALGESRATGGVAGLYGILSASDGRIELQKLGPYSDFASGLLDNPVESPTGWFEESYAASLALRQWPQANLTPNFPVAAEVMLRMYEQQEEIELDGALAMDAITLKQLLRATDPLEIRGLPTSVSSENAADVLLEDIYTEFESEDKQNQYLARLVERFWELVRDGDLEGPTFVSALGEAATTQHLKVYSRTDETQSALDRVGVAGEPKSGSSPAQLVFDNNYAVNKIDAFVERRIDTRIELDSEGDARVTTTVKIANNAPSGDPSLLLGGMRSQDPKPGVSRQQINIMLPQGAGPEMFGRSNGTTTPPSVYEDEDRLVAWDVLQIPPGKSKTVSLTYFVPRAAEVTPEEGTLTFTLEAQTRAVPDDYSVKVELPPGYETREGAGLTSQSSGTLDRPMPVRVAFVKRSD